MNLCLFADLHNSIKRIYLLIISINLNFKRFNSYGQEEIMDNREPVPYTVRSYQLEMLEASLKENIIVTVSLC